MGLTSGFSNKKWVHKIGHARLVGVYFMTFIDIPNRLAVIANFTNRKYAKLGVHEPEVTFGVIFGLYRFLGSYRSVSFYDFGPYDPPFSSYCPKKKRRKLELLQKPETDMPEVTPWKFLPKLLLPKCNIYFYSYLQPISRNSKNQYFVKKKLSLVVLRLQEILLLLVVCGKCLMVLKELMLR